MKVDEIDKGAIARAYARWAPVYDAVFGKVFAPGRAAAIEAAQKIGGRILDVGVGTGISLPAYASTNRIVAVDICEPMLKQAYRRVAEYGLSNIETIAVMDAACMALPNNSFDVVMAQFVITAVPNPEKTLDEFVRVVKPGGEIILVNHIGAESGPRKWFEAAFAPLARKLGWRPEFPWARIATWGERANGVQLLERRHIGPIGHFTLIRFSKAPAAAAAA